MLDADIYGPSQPTMLGITGQPKSRDGKSIEPMRNYGLQSMSIGYMIGGDDAPMIWRGPMATQALDQLLRQTRWDNLDYLVVDLPPGTGDIQLTLAQKVPVTGAIIVTTPQDIALLDARKGLKMFEKVGIKIIGIVENMSTHICSKCGHEEHIFGAGGGEKMCADYNVEFLGSLPLDIRIREQADSGKPTVVAEPDGNIAKTVQADRAARRGEGRRDGAGPQRGIPEDRRAEHLRAGIAHGRFPARWQHGGSIISAVLCSFESFVQCVPNEVSAALLLFLPLPSLADQDADFMAARDAFRVGNARKLECLPRG